MSVYEDVKTIENLLYDCVDQETGEIKDSDFEAALALKEETLQNGLERLCKIRANMLAKYNGIKEEIDRMSLRMSSIWKNIDRIEKYMLALAIMNEGKKIEAGTFTVSTRKSQAVDISNLDIVPSSFVVEKITKSPDKTAIKKAILDGVCVPGASIIERHNLVIK